MPVTTRRTSTRKTKSARKARRRAITGSVRQFVLLEAGYRCGNPTCRHVLTLELHHIEWVRDGGGNEAGNLIALCPNCHALHTADHIPTEAIQAWKAMLDSLNNPSSRSADLLLVLAEDELRMAREGSTPSQLPFRFTGDSLPALAGLLTSGIIAIVRHYSGFGIGGGGAAPSFEVRLTQAGNDLVAAWKQGSPRAVTQALSLARNAT